MWSAGRFVVTLVFWVGFAAVAAACGQDDAVCGDGVVQAPEECDDGNTHLFDGCSATCGIEMGWACSGEPSQCQTICGDGVWFPHEGCDDGNNEDGDGCDANCTPTACGNGVVTFGEDCDDGNQESGDGCSADCVVEGVCGNGIVEAGVGEVCDGPDLNELTCADHGWQTGTLRCDANCTEFLTDACRNVEIILVDEHIPESVAPPVLVDGTHVYWGSGTYLLRALLDGGPAEILADASRIYELALGPSMVYFADHSSASQEWRIWSVPRSGGTPASIAAGLFGLTHLNVDTSHAYWINQTADEVRRVPLTGGTPETVSSGDGGDIHSLLLDGSHVYFVDGQNSRVLRALKVGSASEELVATGEPIGAIAIDSDRLFYTADGIYSVSLTGGAAVTVASEGGGGALTVDATHVYFAGCSGVGRVEKEGGSPVTLAALEHCPGRIFVHGDYVYWGGSLMVARVLK